MSKRLNGSNEDWCVRHKDIGWDDAFIRLNTDAATDTSRQTGSTAPTNTVFYVGSDGVNNDSSNYIHYLWTAIPGYSAFGSYTANNSADGLLVYLGFRPQLILTKNTTSCSWILTDDVRNTSNLATEKVLMHPNNNAHEGQMGSGKIIDFLSNGFKIRTTDCNLNHTNTTDRIIYAAWARNPFKTARAF